MLGRFRPQNVCGQNASSTGTQAMASDIILEEDQVRIVSGALKVEHSDFCLDADSRRSGANSDSPRRAMVHDFGDRLTLNWGHDYPAGIALLGPVSVDHGMKIDGGLSASGEAIVSRLIVFSKKKESFVVGLDGEVIPIGSVEGVASGLLSPQEQLADQKLRTNVADKFGGTAADYTAVDILREIGQLRHELNLLKKKINHP